MQKYKSLDLNGLNRLIRFSNNLFSSIQIRLDFFIKFYRILKNDPQSHHGWYGYLVRKMVFRVEP